MDYGKYIIVEEKGHEVAIVFDFLIEHASFFSFNRKIVSAGFFRVEIPENKNISIVTFGKSISLDIISKRSDAKLIARVFTGN